MVGDRVQTFAHDTQQLNGGRDQILRGVRQRSFGGALREDQKRDGIRQTFGNSSGVLIGLYRVTHEEHKKTADPHQAAESAVQIFVRKIGLPHIDPCEVKAPCRLQRQVAGSVSRITPDA